MDEDIIVAGHSPLRPEIVNTCLEEGLAISLGFLDNLEDSRTRYIPFVIGHVD